MIVRELTLRYASPPTPLHHDARRPISTPADAAALLVPLLDPEPAETFAVLLLNTKRRPLAVAIISRGTLDLSLVHPREVFRPAIVAGAASILTAHNHPSGDPTPSPDDRATWARLDQAGGIIGIPVDDHLIIAGGRYISRYQETPR